MAPPSFAKLIADGTVVPDEGKGPYDLASYHANITGKYRGYKDVKGYDEWFDKNKKIMETYTSWETINLEKADAADPEAGAAVDPEYMFSYGTINGRGLNMATLRPKVIEAQKLMKEGYEGAFKTACSKPNASEAIERIKTLPEKKDQVHQPGGTALDLIKFYKGALGAIGELWTFGQKAIDASGEEDVAASWSIKKARTQRSYCSTHPNPIVGVPLSLSRTQTRARTRTRTLTRTSHM